MTGLGRACLQRGHTVEVCLPFYECLPQDRIEGLRHDRDFDVPKVVLAADVQPVNALTSLSFMAVTQLATAACAVCSGCGPRCRLPLKALRSWYTRFNHQSFAVALLVRLQVRVVTTVPPVLMWPRQYFATGPAVGRAHGGGADADVRLHRRHRRHPRELLHFMSL